MDNKIRKFVAQVRRRIRERLIIDWLLKTAVAGLLAAIAVMGISLVVPFYYAPVVAAVILVIAFFAGILVGVKQTPTFMDSAIKADKFGHQERISTALFLEGREDTFSVLQKKDALRVIEQFSLREAFPVKIAWRNLLMLVGLAMVLVVTSLADTPAKKEARIHKDIQEMVKKEVTKLEEVEKEWEKKDIKENEETKIKDQLKTAKLDMQKADSYEDVKKAKERLEKKLEMQKEKAENEKTKDAISQVEKKLSEYNKQQMEELAKQAQNALEQAKTGNTAEKKKAAEQLQKLAELSGDDNLSKLAEQYEQSGYSDLAQANLEQTLDSSLQALQNTQMAANGNSSNSQMSNQQANANASQSNQNGNTAANGQSNQNGNTAANGQSNQNGNTAANGQSNQNSNTAANGQSQQNASSNNTGEQNAGSGSGNGKTENNNGAGKGNGNGEGNSQGNGKAGQGAGGTGWNSGSKNGSEREENQGERVTIPDSEVGDDENLTGKANDNNSSTKQKSNQANTWAGNKVDYGSVSAEYKEKAYKQIEGANYPAKMKEQIRNYFQGLN